MELQQEVCHLQQNMFQSTFLIVKGKHFAVLSGGEGNSIA